jgi:hypothetical protein
MGLEGLKLNWTGRLSPHQKEPQHGEDETRRDADYGGKHVSLPTDQQQSETPRQRQATANKYVANTLADKVEEFPVRRPQGVHCAIDLPVT